MKTKITEAEESILIAAYLYGACPIIYTASARDLKKKALLQASSIGNMVLTKEGRDIAKAALSRLTKRKAA